MTYRIEMSWNLTKTGILLTIIGMLVMIFGGLLFFASIYYANDEIILDEEDFSQDGNDYTAYYSADKIQDQIEIFITKKVSDMVSVEFELLSSEGARIFTHSGLLPVDATADIGFFTDGDLKFVLNFTTDHDLDDVNIQITMKETADSFAMLCCLSSVIAPTGGLIFLIGGIIWIVAAVRGSKEIKESTNAPKENILCPYCNTKAVVYTKKEISMGGWILFAVLLVTFPFLFWIGLLIKDETKECSNCRHKLEFVDIQRGKNPGVAPPPPVNEKLIQAKNYETAERLEDAAKIYDQLGMWEEAGRCRRKLRGINEKR